MRRVPWPGLVLLLGCMGLWSCKPHAAAPVPPGRPTAVLWDFSADRLTTRINWPAGSSSDYYTLEGDIDFRLMLKDGRLFSDRLHKVEARRYNDRVEQVELFTGPKTLADAYARAGALAEQFAFPREQTARLAAWFEGATAGHAAELKLTLDEDKHSCIIRLRHEETPDKPWCVALDLDWTEACPCDD